MIKLIIFIIWNCEWIILNAYIDIWDVIYTFLYIYICNDLNNWIHNKFYIVCYDYIEKVIYNTCFYNFALSVLK